MQAETAYSGWIYVLAAGLCQGSFMLPMKCTKAWAWENTWLVFAVTAYLICPWLFVFATVPGVTAIYSDASPGRIALVIGMGFLWGLGALTFGLGVDAIGFSIGFAVILGVAACSGTLVPLLFLNPQLLDKVSLLITGLSLSVMLGGVAMCSVAGHWRESPNEQRNYRTGVLICVASGLLSSCGNVGFVLGQPNTWPLRRA
jgi:L-rhamnose-H+ transport protein